MKICPKHFISEFVDRIVNQKAKSHQYLVLLAAVSPGVIEKQYEVIRQLTNPLSIKDVLLYFIPVTSEAYEKKKRMMVPFLSKKDPSPDDLDANLAYHLELLRVFSGCTVGRANMNSVEAKVQSIFNYNDVIMGILDPNSPSVVKIRLMDFLYNAMIEVEMKIPNFGSSKSVWQLVESTIEVFSTVKDLLRQIEKNGWEHPLSHRQKVEYAVMCAKALAAFFSSYFDYSIFKISAQTAIGFERVHLRENQANEMMRSIFQKVRDVYDMQSSLLSKEHHTYFYNVLVVINQKITTPLVAEVKILHEKVNANELDDRDQKSISRRFKEFKAQILSSPEVMEMAKEEENAFLLKIEELPLIKGNADSDIR